MAKVQVQAVQVKQMPSKFGGSPWSIVKVKLVGHGDEVFELDGFGQKEKDNVAAGKTISGYFSERTWNSNNGPVVTKTFCKITAEYVYDLVMKMQGGSTEPAQLIKTTQPAPKPQQPDISPEEVWSSSPANGAYPAPAGFEDPGF